MKNGMYKLHLEDSSSIVVHEDLILKKDLLLTKEIDEDDVKNIDKLNNNYNAYDIAVKNGFKGTETEWLENLKGAAPHIGENGNWFLGDQDMGITAAPDLGGYLSEANLIALSHNEILEICK